jgi:hypothetical protein
VLLLELIMKSSDRLDHLRIASPCPVGWDQMTGDDRVRFCEQCSLRVYNISEMTRTEAEALIAKTEGHICARIYRRFDGTIITRDCPVGLRAIRTRVAKMAGALLTAILTVCANSFASGRVSQRDMSAGRNSLTIFQTNSAIVDGKITDPNGEAIQGATITLINSQTSQKRIVKSDKKGLYRFQVFAVGSCKLKVEAQYFQSFEQTLDLYLGDDVRLDISLMIGGMVGVVVIQSLPRTGFDVNGVHVRINEE